MSIHIFQMHPETLHSSSEAIMDCVKSLLTESAEEPGKYSATAEELTKAKDEIKHFTGDPAEGNLWTQDEGAELLSIFTKLEQILTRDGYLELEFDRSPSDFGNNPNDPLESMAEIPPLGHEENPR